MSTYQVRSLEEADQIIKEHERKTKTTYALLRSTKNFGCVDVPGCANDENEVRFETVGVPYCGVPFFVAGLKILQCQSYRGRGAKKKEKIKIEGGNGACNVIGQYENEHNDQPLLKQALRKKKKASRPHRVGCTATIIMKEVIYYPEFQLYEHSKNIRIAIARQLKDALKAKAQVQKDRIIYITVPSITDHFGHLVNFGTPKTASKRIFVKNDFYGHNEPGSSKRVYYPIKQEKLNMNQITKRLKVDEDDTEAKAKEVREVLQSIMALTYKPGTTEAYQELKKDLLQAKLKYQQTMEALLLGVPTSSVFSSPQEIFSPPQQVIAVQTANSKASDSSGTALVPASVGWAAPGGTATIPTSTTVIPGTARVVAVTALPLAVSSTSGPVTNAVVADQQHSTAGSNPGGGTDNTNQETSIFIEAMEAIFNSQI